MAYDPTNAYEAPRRPYYGQTQQRAPAQPTRRSPQQEQYANGYGQDYSQNYEQHYGTHYEQQQYGARDGYMDQQRQEEATYANGYDQGYQRQQDQQYSNRNQPPQLPHQQQPGRSHDPRYHQRPQKSPPQREYGPSHGSGPPQHLHQADRQGYQVQPQNYHRPIESRNGMQQEASREKYERYEQQSGGAMDSSKSFGNGHTQDAATQQKPKKLTMEEWKASEKAKMHAANSPETIAQDNAFPKFHNAKSGQKHDGHGVGGGSAVGYRSSEERARPSTSGSRPGDRSRQDQRPVMSPDNVSERGSQRQHESVSSRRPSTDHPYSFDSMRNNLHVAQDARKQSFDTRPSADFARPSTASISQQEHYEPQQSVNVQQAFSHNQPRQDAQYGQIADSSSAYQNTRPGSNQRVRPNQPNQHQRPSFDAQQTRLDSRSPPNAQTRQPYDLDSREQSEIDRYRQPAQSYKRGHPSTVRSTAPFAPIDTSIAQSPAFMDHQPLSPAYLPERSTSAQDSRRPSAAAQGPGAVAQYQQGVTARQIGALQVPETNNKHVSLTDVYDDYHQDREPVMSSHSPSPAVHTREDEIEAEMPDFDSAAPAQTSMLHKRNQTVDRHLAGGVASAPPPPMPVNSGQPTNLPVQSPPVQHPQAYQPPYQHPRQPYETLSDRGQVNSGDFDFGLQQTTQEPQHNQRRMPLPNQQQGPPFGQYAAPQPPFAKQTLPRRSMDDARHMPYQQEAYSQRSHANLPPDDPYLARGNANALQPPLQRPEIDRHASAQTTWSDPGLQRVPSAQNAQAGLPRPPRSANGVAPEFQQQNMQNNPDALPRHPPPVRPGLLEQAPVQPAKPPPVRNYNASSTTSTTPSISSHQKVPSVDQSAQPVTRAELERLQTAVTANPNSPKQALIYVKKLVEAASVLASEGGRADTKTTNRNRERYMAEAYKRLKKLAAASYPDAQFYLADCHGSGMLGLEVDPKEAFNLYQAAAKQNHGQAAYRTAVCCEIGPEEGGGTRKDLAKAVQWYRRAAALGDVAAMYKVGMILLKGLLGQQENVGEAVSWLKRSAERADRENPHALHELGTLYEPANTKPQIRNKIIADEKYARELFQQAAGLGYKFSQFRLGQAYEYGHLGLPLDHRSSIQWYSKAAAQGEHQAELALSGWYLTGAEGILEQNDTEAYLWARKAASSEPPLAKAMFAMGYFSEQGIGCPASLDDARRWYGRAASYKFPKALQRLEDLKKNGKQKAAPVNGKLNRKDQKRDEADCVVM